MRIVSLLPSATEIICTLGLANELVGVTHECDYPPSVLSLPKVTRTLIPHDADSATIDSLVRERLNSQRALYTLDMPVLERLKPDFIVTQALCDVCAVAEEEVRAAACSLPGSPRVINLEPMSLSQVLASILDLGQTLGIGDQAKSVVAELQSRIDTVARRSATVSRRPRVVVLEWIDPPFSSGHWTPELVEIAGGDEQIGRANCRSRTIRWEDVIAAEPEVLMLACCGFTVKRTLADLPILQSHLRESQLRCFRDQQIYVVDGSAYFSRSGPRLVDSLEILANCLHPEIHFLPENLSSAKRIHL